MILDLKHIQAVRLLPYLMSNTKLKGGLRCSKAEVALAFIPHFEVFIADYFYTI